MSTFLIYLDVNAVAFLLNQNLIPYLKSWGSWAKLTDTNALWLIKSTRSAYQIRDDINNIIGAQGISNKVLVIEVTKANWASLNLPNDLVSWLKSNM